MTEAGQYGGQNSVSKPVVAERTQQGSQAWHPEGARRRRSAYVAGARVDGQRGSPERRSCRRQEPSTHAALACSSAHALNTSPSGLIQLPEIGPDVSSPQVRCPEFLEWGGRRRTAREPRSGVNSARRGLLEIVVIVGLHLDIPSFPDFVSPHTSSRTFVIQSRQHYSIRDDQGCLGLSVAMRKSPPVAKSWSPLVAR